MGRPLPTFEGFVGQRRVVSVLKRLTDDSIAHVRPVPPLLLVAPSGFGKSALVRAAAARLAASKSDEPSNLHVVQGAPRTAERIRDVLFRANVADVLFIDEVHSCDAVAQELLFAALDRNATPDLDANDRLDWSHFVPVAPISYIAATDRPGLLKRALAARLTRLELTEYTTRELRTIAQRAAESAGFSLTAQAAGVIARHHHTPRGVRHLVELTHRLVDSPHVTANRARRVLRQLGVDEHGTSPHERMFLRALADAPNGQLSASALERALSLDPKHVRDAIEAPLVRRGMVTINANRIRQITTVGRAAVAPSARESSLASAP